MSYIGRGIDQIDNISTLDNLSFNGSDATFNLTQNSVAFVPVSADALQIQIDGIIQSGNYTVSSSTVTFDFTPSSSSVCNGIKHFGVGLLTTVSDSSITTAKLGTDAVTTAKINDGAVTSGKIASGVIPTSRPNANPLIINGDMAVAQRSTSATGKTGSGLYAVDRMALGIDSLGTWTVAQETLTSGNAYINGFTKAFRIDCTTANASPSAGNNIFFQYKLEGNSVQVFKKGTANAEKFTLSFWVKSNKTGTAQVLLQDKDNSRNVGATYSISSANTWEQKVLNFPADTTGAFGNDNNKSLEIEWSIDAGSDFTGGTLPTTWTTANNNQRSVNDLALGDNTANDWAITGIQLEVGEYTSSTLPPFQHESYGDNLLRCQRYYYKKIDPGYFGVGNIDGNNDAQIFVNFPTTLRTNPSALETSGTASHYLIRTTFNTTCDAVPVFSSSGTSQAMTIFKKTNHGITNGAAAFGRSDSSSAYLAWSAEL